MSNQINFTHHLESGDPAIHPLPGREQDWSLALQEWIDRATAQTALVDYSGKIVAVNRAWRSFARNNGMVGESYGLGTNYLELCEAAHGDPDASVVAEGLRAVLERRFKGFRYNYAGHSPSERRWFRVRISRLDAADHLIEVVHQRIM